MRSMLLQRLLRPSHGVRNGVRQYCKYPGRQTTFSSQVPIDHRDNDDFVDPDLDTLLIRNKAWVEETNREDSEFFKRLGSGQEPKYLYIGCSDSRVSAELMLGVQPGELFVHRNVANMVVNTDLNLMTVLAYAVEVKYKYI